MTTSISFKLDGFGRCWVADRDVFLPASVRGLVAELDAEADPELDVAAATDRVLGMASGIIFMYCR